MQVWRLDTAAVTAAEPPAAATIATAESAAFAATHNVCVGDGLHAARDGEQ